MERSISWTSFNRYHMAGALIALALMLMWASRQELKEGFLGAVWLRKTHRREDELISPAAAARGFIIGTVVLIVWGIAAGGQLFAVVSLLFLLLCMMVVFSRLVAAAGVLWVTARWDPIHIITKVFGTTSLSPASYTMMNWWTMGFTWHGSQFLMPYVMDGLAITHRGRLAPRWILWGMIGAIALSAITATVFSLSFIYSHGASYLSEYQTQHLPGWALRLFSSYLRQPEPTDPYAVAFLVSGAVAMWLLVQAHLAFVWWPLYPLPYVIGGTKLIMTLWFPAFAGWLAKALILRAGGGAAYRAARPLFLGMILGEFFLVGLWVIVDAVTGTTGHVIISG